MHCNCDRMIGYHDAACAVRDSTIFGRSSLQTVLGNVQCTGAERSLDMCSFAVTGSSNTGCSYSYYYRYREAGIVCFNSKLLVIDNIFISTFLMVLYYYYIISFTDWSATYHSIG